MNQHARRLRRTIAAVALLGIAAAAAAIAVGPGARPVVAIGPGVVTIGTSVHNANHDVVASATVGTLIHPAFVVSGTSGTPTGGFGVEKWNNATCSGTHDYIYGGVLTNGVIDANWLDETSTAATTISYKGEYDGNGTYAAKVGACTSFTFTKASPAVSIHMHDVDHVTHTTFPVTSLIHATVTVTGRVDTPTGGVRIRSWPNGTCSGASGLVGPYALIGGTVDTPYQWPMNAAGTFSFRADYLGDSTYSTDVSACLSITITKFTPTLTGFFHDASHNVVTQAKLDDIIHAAATLSGQLGTPTGTLTVRQWTITENCQGPAALIETSTAAATMDGVGSAAGGGIPGHREWQLTYEGDAHYEAVTGPCMSIAWLAVPSAVSLGVHDAAHHSVTTAPAGTALHLRAAVTGAFATPTGKVTLHRYGNATCSGSGTTIGTPSLTSGVVDKVGLDFTYNSPGMYSFKAGYQGDASYESRNSSCVTVVITAAVPTPTPTSGPTAAPTAHPTANPTVAPPSAQPTPVATVAAPSPEPSPSPAPEVTAPPPSGSTPAPGSAAPGATNLPAATDGPTASPGPTSPSGDSGSSSGFLWLFVLIALLVIVVGFWFSRRRRTAAKP